MLTRGKFFESFTKIGSSFLKQWQESKASVVTESSRFVLSCVTIAIYGEEFLEKYPEFPTWVFKFESSGFQIPVMMAPWFPFGAAAEFRKWQSIVRTHVRKEIALRYEKLAKGEDIGTSYLSLLIQHMKKINRE